MQRRKNMAQIQYMFYVFIIILFVFFIPTKSTIRALRMAPCKARADCSKLMCELPKISWCFHGYCECVQV
ncbi:putative Late nodulin [Medicago truncatula]|nr:putative Late nodulin [Medicago truncatula]